MLFDQVQLVDFVPRYENEFDEVILDAYESSQETLAAAKEIKQSYDSELKRLMAKHAIRTEFEAWSVFVLSHNLEARDYTFAEEFGRTIGMLKSRFQELCCEAAGAQGRHDPKISPFVAAMYKVAAKEMRDAVRAARDASEPMTPENMPFMSFPWLFVDELGRIRTGHKPRGPGGAFVPQQHGFPKKHAKREPEGKAGDIETVQGITHFGEMLRLDFDQSMYTLNGMRWVVH